MFVVEILNVSITELVEALNRIGADLLTHTVKAKTILSVAKKFLRLLSEHQNLPVSPFPSSAGGEYW